MLLSTFEVINASDSGPGSLRESITFANENAGADIITFNIGGGGVQTIQPLSALPIITDPLTIDGATQSGFAGTPLIELSGNLAGGSSGFVITAGSSTVRSLVINRFNGYGVMIQSGGSNVLEGNYIGTDSTGNVALGNTVFGVLLVASPDNIIGGTTPGAGNVISGNGGGIRLELSGSTRNLIAGNIIGLNAAGTARRGNSSFGIYLLDAPSNTIGGTSASARNVISGNVGHGLQINNAHLNIVTGNYIGTNAAGTAALGNDFGVDLRNTARNTIGGTAPGAGNVISGNTRGVNIQDEWGRDNFVAGNRIGLNAAGNAVLPNIAHGVVIQSADNTLFQNVISGNAGFGISLIGATATRTIIQGNLIGTDATGTLRRGNVLTGIRISDAPGNTIGGTAPWARNVISGNNGGIGITGTAAAQNLVVGNYIGTNSAGTAALGNAGAGIFTNSPNNVFGGATPDARNVISGNTGNGIQFIGITATQNVVVGNFIGTNAAGTAALGNGADGVLIAGGARYNRIGTNGLDDFNSAERNIISANGWVGVEIGGAGTDFNTIAGNYIGTDVSGTQPLGNAAFGVANVAGAWNRIEDNVVADTRLYGGIFLLGPGANHNVIAGNYVGTDASGTQPLGNPSGIWISFGEFNRIGTNGDGVQDDLERNIVSGNSSGVTVYGATSTVVAGNHIGTDPSGTLNLGNSLYGVNLLAGASDNIIGGTTPFAGNTIAYNGGQGVIVQDAGTVANQVRGNAIFANGALGIDLGGDGISPNDAGDTDTGANSLQNFPVLLTVLPGATTTVQGTLNSTPDTFFALDFYASPASDAEGARYLGSASMTTNGSGNGAFTATTLGAVFVGEVVTATATDPLGNTSELSTFSVPIFNRPPTALAGGPYSVPEGGSVVLDGSGSSDPDQPAETLTYEWDLDGDNIFGETGTGATRGDEIGIAPTFSAAGLDGPSSETVFLRVTDSGGMTSNDNATVDVTNEAPTITSFTGPMDNVVRGQLLSYSANFFDPGTPDTHTAVFEWGDTTVSAGVVTETKPGSTGSVSGSHVYTASGTYTINLTVTDDDGDTISITKQVTVSMVAIGEGCCETNALLISGTLGDDTVRVVPQGKQTGAATDVVKVLINGQDQGTFSGFGKIVIIGQAGNDDLEIAGSIKHDTCLFGGDGNDRMKGSRGNNILWGGDGDDLLLGDNQGLSLLIGGSGSDRLVGHAGSDILVAGTTDHDEDEETLCAIMAQWTSSADYTTRAEAVSAYLNSATVHDDDAKDMLTGAAGMDLFFANLSEGILDNIIDQHSGELAFDEA